MLRDMEDDYFASDSNNNNNHSSNNSNNNNTYDPSEVADSSPWLATLQFSVGTYALPTLVWMGVFFNVSSIAFLHNREVRLRKSLVQLFTFLNIFDSIFLVSTFLVFGLPNISTPYHNHFSPHLIPFLVPILQTCLTISVYSTVAIAVTCIFIVNPMDEGPVRNFIKFHKVNVASIGCLGIFVASSVFNLSRWFELRTVVSSSGESNETFVVTTPLREDADYVQFYSLIGSGIVMVFIPFLALLVACGSIKRSMVAGTQKRKTLRLMTIIIVMFLICHSPKVILTVYEVCYHRWEGGRDSNWSSWALVLKELSQVLLVSYSAFNPLAYCGDLVVRKTLQRSSRWLCCCRKQLSEIEMMESVGVTMRGVDSIEQQLAELDPQSRILSGLRPKEVKRSQLM